MHNLKVDTQNSNHIDLLMEVVPLLKQGRLSQMSNSILMTLVLEIVG